MTQPIGVYRLGEDFYVPYFAVTLNGSRLADNVIHDVMQVTYRDSISEIDLFELTLNNWDAQRGSFKYEPFSDESFKGLFDPGVELELTMGYMNNHRLMLSGHITTLEPNYPAAGGPTLSVRGLNVLHRFRRKQHTWAWNDPPYCDSEVAEWIGNQPVSDDRPGLDMEVHIDPNFRVNEKPDTIFMDNQYDIVFLMARGSPAWLCPLPEYGQRKPPAVSLLWPIRSAG